MAAQIDFSRWREPAKIVAVITRNNKRRFRQIIFSGDALQELIVKPGIQRTNGRRVAGERAQRESVDLI